MKIQSTRERLLASSMICGAAFLGLSATQANAAAAAPAANAEVSEIVVTGTRIPTPNLTSVAILAAIVLIRTFLSFSLEVETTGRWPWQQRDTAAS